MTKIDFYRTKLLTICFIVFSSLLIILISCNTLADKDSGRMDPHQSISEEEHRLDWFREAKFGMFIHWGHIHSWPENIRE